jgi:hypothetical protein
MLFKYLLSIVDSIFVKPNFGFRPVGALIIGSDSISM